MVMTWPVYKMSAFALRIYFDFEDLPLTQPPSAEARKATTRATSSGTAQRLSGQCSAIRPSIFSAGQSGVPPYDLSVSHCAY